MSSVIILLILIKGVREIIYDIFIQIFFLVEVFKLRLIENSVQEEIMYIDLYKMLFIVFFFFVLVLMNRYVFLFCGILLLNDIIFFFLFK